MRKIEVCGNLIGICEGTDCENFANEIDAVIIGYGEGLTAHFDDEKTRDGGGVAEVVARSGVFKCPVFGGVKTSYSGLKSISAAVANFGRLIDIVDRTINVRGDEYAASDKIKIYKTGKCSAALLIDTDILLSKNWERVSPIADIIIGIALDISDEEAALVATLSNLFDIGYLLLATNRLEWRSV